MTVTVRPALVDDAARVAEIYVDSWNAGFGTMMPSLELDSSRIASWAETLRDGSTKWWVAEAPGRVLGFVGIGPSRDPVDPKLGELDTIAVDPDCWRGGVGTALMRTAVAALIDDGFEQAILWTLADYPRGWAFYRSAGWRPDGGSRDNGHQVSFRHSLHSVEPC